MKVSNKIHRGYAIAAAIVMGISLLFAMGSNAANLISMMRFSGSGLDVMTVVSMAMNILCHVLLLVVVLRGKKDLTAGVLAVVTVLPLMLTLLRNVTSMLSTASTGNVYYILATLVLMIANFVNLVFRVLLAAECFRPGAVSGGNGKMLLIVFPVAYILLLVLGNVLPQLYMASMIGIGSVLVTVVLSNVFTVLLNMGTVVLGLALSVAVYEEKLLGS